MSVKIRLSRKGRKHLALYDIVVADSRSPRDGRFIKKIGNYNTNTNPPSIKIDEDLALKWLFNGAQPTNTVRNILSCKGILLKKHLQTGVLKGFATQEDVSLKLEKWRENKKTVLKK